MGLIFFILMIGFICFQVGTLFPRSRPRPRTRAKGSRYYVPLFRARFDDDWQPRWSMTRKWYVNTDHKQWQKEFDALNSKR